MIRFGREKVLHEHDDEHVEVQDRQNRGLLLGQFPNALPGPGSASEVYSKA